MDDSISIGQTRLLATPRYVSLQRGTSALYPEISLRLGDVVQMMHRLLACVYEQVDPKAMCVVDDSLSYYVARLRWQNQVSQVELAASIGYLGITAVLWPSWSLQRISANSLATWTCQCIRRGRDRGRLQVYREARGIRFTGIDTADPLFKGIPRAELSGPILPARDLADDMVEVIGRELALAGIG